LQLNPTKRPNNTATEYGTAEGLSLDIFNFQVGRSEIGVKFHPKKKNSLPQNQESKQLQGTKAAKQHIIIQPYLN